MKLLKYEQERESTNTMRSMRARNLFQRLHGKAQGSPASRQGRQRKQATFQGHPRQDQPGAGQGNGAPWMLYLERIAEPGMEWPLCFQA